jgi:hypothetical protein
MDHRDTHAARSELFQNSQPVNFFGSFLLIEKMNNRVLQTRGVVEIGKFITLFGFYRYSLGDPIFLRLSKKLLICQYLHLNN